MLLPVAAAAATATLNFPVDGELNVPRPPQLSVTVSNTMPANLTVKFYGRMAAPAPGADFTLVALPDTQYYASSLNGGSPAMMISQTDWIVANRSSHNIQFVAQLGDCVQNGDNGGNAAEWRNATNSLYRLENPATTLLTEGIPYALAVGNHDQSPIGSASGTTTFYNQYFGTNHFTPRSYYGGHYGGNNDNHFELFSASGLDFIVIFLEFNTGATTSSAVMQWARTTLQAHSNHRAIVVSHWIINDGFNATFSSQGQAIYNGLRTNANLFLMLCGHVTPEEGQRTDSFQGRTIWTVMSDYQDRANGGNGWLRLYEFSPSNNVIHVKTFSPWLNQFETDADSQFDIPYVMDSTNSFTALATNVVPSGAEAVAVWPNLDANTTYEWYVTVSDGVSTTTGPVWTFTTGSQPLPPMPPTVSLSSPANNAIFGVSDSILLSANASDLDGLVTNVAFYAGANLIGSDAVSPFTFAWSGVVTGAFTLTAVATDGTGLMSTSAPVSISVLNLVTNTLTATGSEWKYLDNGSDQGAAWMATGFDDSTWASGPAELGYGDASDGRPEATLVSFGPNSNNKYVTTYFRRTFALSGAGNYISLNLRVLRDDGVAVYLNGNEVFRNNLGAGAGFNTLASSAVSGANETAFLATAVNPTLLVEGNNVLAAEIHQNSTASSDISFDLELAGAGDAAISAAPSVLSLTGVVRYAPTNYPPGNPSVKTVGDAAINLSGDTNLNTLSLGDGSFGLSGIAGGGTFGVTPGKTNDSPAANGVTTLDIALIRQHILSPASSSLKTPYKLLAADVNGSGSVSTLDIALIRQLILGGSTQFPAGLWRFVPVDYLFPNTNAPWTAPTNRWHTNLAANVVAEDFVAIKLGDVNDSWTMPVGMSSLATGTEGVTAASLTPPIRFQIGHQVVQPGTRVTVPITVSDFQDVTSAQFTLAWDAAVLRYEGVGNYGLSGLSAGNFGLARTVEGKLTFSWNDPGTAGVTLADGTVVYSVSFEVTGPGGSVSTLALGDAPTLREASVNLAVATIAAEAGEVRVIDVNGLHLSEAAYHEGVFELMVSTETGRRYVLEFTDRLPATEWTALQFLDGDGTVHVVVDSSATNQQRYYRMRME